MKYLKIMIIALVAMFSFAKAEAQVHVGVRFGGHPHHRRVVVVHHRYHRHVVVEHRRY
jgi:hypothetical protein